MVRISIHTPRMFRTFQRPRYIVITMKGIQFIEKWYTVDHIPSHLTRLYQFLLRLIWMKGTMTTRHAQKLGYFKKDLKLIRSNGYIEIQNSPHKPSEAIQTKIIVMTGEPPRWIYA